MTGNHEEPTVPYAANAVRLSPRECIIAAAIVTAVLAVMPIAADRWEAFHPDADYRMPHSLSEDYHLAGRHARHAARQSKTLLVGDSAVWGEYVTRRQTLAQCLNGLAGEDRFANLGASGMHPAALAGLLEYYGRGITNRRVVLHCNLLWTASKRHDLQTEKEQTFNHPALVPQFVPHIPCYDATYSERLANVVERTAPFRSWARHLRVAYFDNKDLPTWTIENPRGNPFARIPAGPPQPSDALRHEPISWTARGITEQDFDWVELSTSLQWSSFRRAVEILRSRGNRVFVLVGPFNEHMLTPASRDRYTRRKQEVRAWLDEARVPCYVPDALPTALYADASHPLAAGYARLAEQLWRHPTFAEFDGHTARPVTRPSFRPR